MLKPFKIEDSEAVPQEPKEPILDFTLRYAKDHHGHPWLSKRGFEDTWVREYSDVAEVREWYHKDGAISNKELRSRLKGG